MRLVLFKSDCMRSLSAEKLGKTISEWITAKLWLLPRVAGSVRDQKHWIFEIYTAVRLTKKKQLMNTIKTMRLPQTQGLPKNHSHLIHTGKTFKSQTNRVENWVFSSGCLVKLIAIAKYSNRMSHFFTKVKNQSGTSTKRKEWLTSIDELGGVCLSVMGRRTKSKTSDIKKKIPLSVFKSHKSKHLYFIYATIQISLCL